MPNEIRFDDVDRWLLDAALPFWLERGVDRRLGGFVEQLTLQGENGAAPFKRIRAQARQVYCFSHAALLGLAPGAAEAADHGWRFLTQHGRRADGAWVRRLDPAGEVLDATCDAYDMAFVLFAHAWRYRLDPNSAILASALSTVDALDRVLAHPNGLGWLAEEGDHGPRQQNPHMHLIEATIELADATGHSRFHELGISIADLFLNQIMDPDTGAVRELFQPDWTPLDRPAGRLVEPGHQLEWAWILHHGQSLLGLDCGRNILKLYNSAEDVGVDRLTGLTFDQVDVDGAVVTRRSRSWPQTEALKANLAVLEGHSIRSLPRIAACVSNLLDRYLAPAPRGAWIDQLDDQGRPDVDKIPSTTFYHILLAFAELRRLRPQIEGGLGAEA